MLDHMLSNNGFNESDKATNFIKKYNQSVFYDKSLLLEGRAAQRQSLLLDAAKASPMLKRLHLPS